MSTGFASAGFDAIGYAPGSFEAVDRAIEARADQAFAFLERLVAADSTVGNESPAQEIVAAELDRLGFDGLPAAHPARHRRGGAWRRGPGVLRRAL